MSIKDKYVVRSIDSYECNDWLLRKHYAKRIPMICYSFGLFDGNILRGVMTIGKPASPSLCDGVCGKQFSQYVYELNRLCIDEGMDKNVLSYFVSSSLRLINVDMILVSYADTSMNHHGYIYQATNFLYTGLSAKMNEWREKDSNKHCRTLFGKYKASEMKESDRFEFVERPRKHRYIYFLGKKKKIFMKSLNYKIEPYPKGDNKRYDSSYKPTTQISIF